MLQCGDRAAAREGFKLFLVVEREPEVLAAAAVTTLRDIEPLCAPRVLATSGVTARWLTTNTQAA
jgi:hypothetical protein